jgi:hypothetical protein
MGSPRPGVHAIRYAKARCGSFSIVAVDEPSIWPSLCGRSRKSGIAVAKRMVTAFGLFTDACFYTCDPFHSLDEEVFVATDALVATGWISVVGVNYYPHHSTVPLADVLRAV